MDDFNQEVLDRLATFLRITPAPDGRWAMYLDPYMLAGFSEQLLMPGQVVSIGDNGYIVKNEALANLERKDVDLLKGYSHFWVEPKVWQKMWAARPYFHSAEAALSLGISWLLQSRQDIVEACRAETRLAIGYRRNLANKARA